MRIAMLGAGYMAGLHADAWSRIEGVEVTRVVGRGPENASLLAARLGARPGTEVRAALDDPSIAAVDITVPTTLHPALAAAALDAGKSVLCETPLARTSGEAQGMVDLARSRGRHLQVALLHRFARQNLHFRDRLLSGDLGRVRTVTARRLAPGTGGAHHGDAVEELMLFDLDFLLWTLGELEVIGASAWRDDVGGIRQATALLDARGARVEVEASFLLPRSHPFATTLFAACERGAVEGSTSHPRDGPPSTRCAEYPAAGPAVVGSDPGEDPVLGECRRFAAVVHGEADPALLDGSNAVAALRLSERIRASLA